MAANRVSEIPSPGNVSGPLLNAFSVDVEDYYQVAAFEGAVRRESWSRYEPRVDRNTRRILGLLERHGVRATFFVLGWIAERNRELVQEIVARGHELAAHGYDHRRITELTPAEFRADVRKTKRLLEEIGGSEVIGYRAPTYSVVDRTLWALEVLAEEGYLYDSSIFPIRHDRYGIPSAKRFPGVVEAAQPLVEFPISTVRLLGLNLPFIGGGYLRHLPLAFMLWGMRRVNRREGQPVMFYVHPWEIDPEQPRLPAGRLTRVRHYRNLARTEERLQAILGRFRFTTVREVLGC